MLVRLYDATAARVDIHIRPLLLSKDMPMYTYASIVFQCTDNFLNFIKAFFVFKTVILNDCLDFLQSLVANILCDCK